MRFQNKLSTFMCVAFVIAIATPMVVSVLQEDKAVSQSEKRQLQAWPLFDEASSVRSYFNSINAYINDHFGFREELIELNNKIRYSLNESPVKTVIRGSGEWLFYKIHDPLMSNHPLSEEVLKGNLVARADYIKQSYREFKGQGIVYQHIVVPNKMSLYPEYLPKLYALTDINATYDFFKKQLSATSKTIAFDAIDVLEPYVTNDYGFDLYFKNDTHWNAVGAYLVYRESLRRLKKEEPSMALAIKDHTFRPQVKAGGDLANFIGLSSSLTAREPRTEFPSCTDRANIKLVKQGLSLATCNTNDTTMLLVADSFITGIYAYMSESVGSLYMTGQKTTRADLKQIIEDVKPDVVVEILVERSLVRELP